MKKLLLSIPLTLIMMSCGGNGSSSTTITQEIAPADTVTMQQTTGIAIDGAMNSILIKTAEGDTVGFGYPEIDPKNKEPWMIGDTVTVTHINVNGMDSVISLRKGELK